MGSVSRASAAARTPTFRPVENASQAPSSLARKRLNNGAKAVHLLSEMMSGMEGEITEESATVGVQTPEAEAFDAFLIDDEPAPQSEEENDEAMFTNYISSYFVDEPNALTGEEATQDFRIGGGRLQSFYVAEIISGI